VAHAALWGHAVDWARTGLTAAHDAAVRVALDALGFDAPLGAIRTRVGGQPPLEYGLIQLARARYALQHALAPKPAASLPLAPLDDAATSMLAPAPPVLAAAPALVLASASSVISAATDEFADPELDALLAGVPSGSRDAVTEAHVEALVRLHAPISLARLVTLAHQLQQPLPPSLLQTALDSLCQQLVLLFDEQKRCYSIL
jgi:hypothetical protein